MAHRRSRANRLVRSLRVLLLFERVGRLGQVSRAIFLANVFAHFLDGLGSNPGRIGTHVGDQTDQAFVAQFHAFIQALRNHHGALHAEAQLARRVLLQFAGGERRGGVAAALFLVDRSDDPVGCFQGSANLFGVFAVGDFDLLFALAHESARRTPAACWRRGARRWSSTHFLERLDLAFAFDNQAQRDGLHAPGRETAAHFIPQQRRNLISHEPVEHAAGLLRVDQVLIDGPRMFKRCLHRALGDFVEGNALDARRRRFLALLYLTFLAFFPLPLSPSSNARWAAMASPSRSGSGAR